MLFVALVHFLTYNATHNDIVIFAATYEDFLNTAIPAGGMERAFFMEMRAYFHELVKNQKKCIIEISVNDDVYSENRPAQTLQEALQQRNSNINGKQRFRKLPNKRRKEQQVRLFSCSNCSCFDIFTHASSSLMLFLHVFR